VSAKAHKRHTRKVRRLGKARRRSRKRIVKHRCLKGRTGTAHSKVNRPRVSEPYRAEYPLEMASARLYSVVAWDSVYDTIARVLLDALRDDPMRQVRGRVDFPGPRV